MFLNKTADKLVFKFLNNINYGYLELTTIDGKILKFGNSDEKLKANIVIKKPNFNYNLIRGGSIGFAESYMRGEFETVICLSNLPGRNKAGSKTSGLFVAAIMITPALASNPSISTNN